MVQAKLMIVVHQFFLRVFNKTTKSKVKQRHQTIIILTYLFSFLAIGHGSPMPRHQSTKKEQKWQTLYLSHHFLLFHQLNGPIMSFCSHSMTAPQWEWGFGFLWHDTAPLCSTSSTPPPPRDHTLFTTATLPMLMPDLPSVIFLNTRVKWEGTNHCNYVQWVLQWWLCKVWDLDGSLTVSHHTTHAWVTIKCFQYHPEWNGLVAEPIRLIIVICN